MFVDKTHIFIKAGNGGDGSISFLRDKQTMNGGPDGGNGGNGGSIIFTVDEGINNLVDFYYTKKYRAEYGTNGGHLKCNGKNGQDLIIKVPQGTIIKDEEGNVVADMFDAKQRTVVLKGGKGGRGNYNFATPRRQAPSFAETGVKTKEYKVILELKTIADVGLIGFPSVGKSKLLSVLTSARPKIADYHFTTLTPNLGVAKYYDQNILIADIPGLIEGASEGKGLGFDFLRRIERTRMLVHVIDIASVDGRDPIEDFVIINRELENYSKSLSKLKQIIVLNKIDLLNGDRTKIEEFRKEYEKDFTIIEISCATRENLDVLLKEITNVLSTLPKLEPIVSMVTKLDVNDKTKFEVVKEGNIFIVIGGYVDELIRLINMGDPESMAYFQRRLKNDGVIDKLIASGMKEGDIVRVGNFEYEYVE